jgi:hypothetical protein
MFRAVRERKTVKMCVWEKIRVCEQSHRERKRERGERERERRVRERERERERETERVRAREREIEPPWLINKLAGESPSFRGNWDRRREREREQSERERARKVWEWGLYEDPFGKVYGVGAVRGTWGGTASAPSGGRGGGREKADRREKKTGEGGQVCEKESNVREREKRERESCVRTCSAKASSRALAPSGDRLLSFRSRRRRDAHSRTCHYIYIYR